MNALTSIDGRLGFGAAGFGNLFAERSEEQVRQIAEAAWDAGMRYFDTAPHYGLGLSERRLGAFLATKPREEFVLSTKVGRLLTPVSNPTGALDLANDFHVPADHERVQDYTAGGIRRSIEDSLERLGLDRIDIAYLHDPDKAEIGLDAALDQALPALEQLRDEGIVEAVGVGSMSTAAMVAAVRRADLDVLMCAGRYTLLEQGAAAELLPLCLERDVRVVTASIFNSGLLARATPSRSGRYEYGAVPPELYERAVAIAAVCARHGVELPTAALQYTLRHPAVAAVVVGISRLEQVAQNNERMAVPVPDRLWSDLAAEGLIPA
ncbi:aldo/keto reductase [Pseudactinotalea sp. HY160]|uniref:aldo/keto reductase n=1 Tax=Pseudactinotalea sp. HY160 TaxID=2654490 RepID=UPI00128D5B05|nr:aldo/keto reductase [Pseudactinotalea sp. HY160]MPV48496.1 aldo/keto reductase [Pseudactinotalea sp. HY160]